MSLAYYFHTYRDGATAFTFDQSANRTSELWLGKYESMLGNECHKCRKLDH